MSFLSKICYTLSCVSSMFVLLLMEGNIRRNHGIRALAWTAAFVTTSTHSPTASFWIPPCGTASLDLPQILAHMFRLPPYTLVCTWLGNGECFESYFKRMFLHDTCFTLSIGASLILRGMVTEVGFFIHSACMACTLTFVWGSFKNLPQIRHIRQFGLVLIRSFEA